MPSAKGASGVRVSEADHAALKIMPSRLYQVFLWNVVHVATAEAAVDSMPPRC